jgi:uncharacterized membrane protein YfcA
VELLSTYLPTIIALVGTGVFAGLLAGLLGVGGGIVIVPVLYFLFQQFGVSAQSAMPIATATSLATIVATSISSIKAHLKRDNVDMALLKRWGVFILFGVLMGSWLVTVVNGQFLILFFGLIACYAAYNMLFKTQSVISESLPSMLIQRMIAACIGMFSAMAGIGGGTLSVPLLSLFGYDAKKAVGTAAAIGLVIALPGALTLLAVGQTPLDAPVGTFGLVNLFAFACIVPLTVLFAPVGASLTTKINSQTLKKVFAVVLLITGVRMLLQIIL